MEAESAAASGSPEPTPQADNQEGDDKQAGFAARTVDVLLQALPTLVGAVGFVGFVALAGGAIQWLRFSAAELPADQAVGVIPRSELVTIGASFLVVYTLLGLLAVLVVYALDRNGNASRPTRIGLVVVAVVEMGIAFYYADIPTWGLGVGFVWLALVGLATAGSLGRLATRVNRRAARAQARADVGLLADQVLAAGSKADDAWSLFEVISEEDPPPDDKDPDRIPPKENEALPMSAPRYEAYAAWEAAVRELRLLESRAERQRREVKDLAFDERELAFLSTRDFEPESVRAVLSERVLLGGGPRLDALQANLSIGGIRGWLSPSELRLRLLRFAQRVGLRRGLGVAGLLIAATLAVLLYDADKIGWFVALAAAAAALVVIVPNATGATVALIAAGAITVVSIEETAWLALILAFVGLLAFANLAVARSTKHFAWYGAMVFLSVPAFGFFLTADRTIRTPKVQPAALVRSGDDRALCGVYITETKDRVYLGRVEARPGSDDPDPATGRIFWFPATKVDIVKIGPLQDLDEAERRALGLRAEVEADRAQEAAGSLKNKVTATTRKTSEQETTVTTEETPQPRRAPSSKPAADRPVGSCTATDL